MAETADIYAPFDDGPGSDVTEDTWRKFMRRPVVSGVLRSVLNEHEVTANSTGMKVTVDTGEVWLEGHWGTLTSSVDLPIATADGTQNRVDRVVARLDAANNVIEYDVKTGTPGSTSAPTLTRNDSVWETSLATVDVDHDVVTIAAGDVKDTRFFGGNVGYNVTDDLTMFGDKYSTCRRIDMAEGTSGQNNGDLFAVRMRANVEYNITTLRMFLCATAQSGGSFNWGIFKGFRQDDLTRIANGTISLTSGTNTVKEATFTEVTIEAGMEVVIAYLQLSASTIPTLGKSSTVVNQAILNPSSTVKSTVIKTGVASIPTTLNLLDGSWSGRDRYTWAALA